jgi:hypothetical protein
VKSLKESLDKLNVLIEKQQELLTHHGIEIEKIKERCALLREFREDCAGSS